MKNPCELAISKVKNERARRAKWQTDSSRKPELAMCAIRELSSGWTIAEAVERTSDPDLIVAENENGSALNWKKTATWEQLSEGELLATGCFDTPSAPSLAIDPKVFSTLNWSGPPSTTLRGIAGSEASIFNVRVFPVLHAPNALDRLSGLSLTEVFRRYIIGDPEIVSLSKGVLKGGREYSAVFSEGQAPGPFVDFHWPLETTASAIARRFVDSPLVIIGDPLPAPSRAISAVSKVLADRVGALRDLLVSGRIVAFGTFAQTGVEGPIGRLQWTRSDISIDVRSGDLCEGQDYRAVPKWTGVDLRLPGAPMPANLAPSGPARKIDETAPKATGQIQTKEKSRLECLVWLTGLMSDPQIVPRSRDDLWDEARLKWPNKISKRAFLNTRDGAISETGALVWKAAGRKPKSKHS